MANHNFSTLLDQQRMAANFNRAAALPPMHLVSPQVVAKEMLARLAFFRLAPTCILDLGTGQGAAVHLLAQHYPAVPIVGIDLAKEMLQHVRQNSMCQNQALQLLQANVTALPLATQSVDLVCANLLLYWVLDLSRLFAEIKRVLKPGGLFFFSTLGPRTLHELRTSFAAVDGYVHVHPTVEPHDLGNLLMSAGLLEPVLDSEKTLLFYPTLSNLMRTLKDSGEGNVWAQRRKGLLSRASWQRLQQAYQDFYVTGKGLAATVEVVYGHAWQPEVAISPLVANPDGTVAIPIDKIIKRY